jgi:hypothetical protein
MCGLGKQRSSYPRNTLTVPFRYAFCFLKKKIFGRESPGQDNVR